MTLISADAAPEPPKPKPPVVEINVICECGASEEVAVWQMAEPRNCKGCGEPITFTLQQIMRAQQQAAQAERFLQARIDEGATPEQAKADFDEERRKVRESGEEVHTSPP